MQGWEKLGMMQNLNIRAMTEQDISAVAMLERENFSNPWTHEMLLEELALSCAQYFVAEVDGSVIGYAGMQIILDEGYVTNIAVSNAFRRKGVASALITRLLEAPLSFLSLEVRKSNAPAIALYQKFGFTECGLRRNYYTNPTEDALILTCMRGETK